MTGTTTRPVVTILVDTELPGGLDRLEQLAEVRITRGDRLAECLPGSDVLYLWDFFSPSLVEAWPRADRLRWVHVAAAGVDKLLFPALVESEVLVTNARGTFDLPIAEYVLGCILRHAKQLDVTQRDQAQRRWNTRATSNVSGASALVVGVGGIGRETARLLRAVGMRVEGAGRTARPGDEIFGRIHASARLVDLVGRFDYVVLAAPLTPGTDGLFGREVIGAMKPGSYLVNVGRGRVVDETALAEALSSGRIAGAALDTFETEPLPADSPLWALDSVLVSPHTSSRTEGWLDRLSEQFIDNLEIWMRGGTPPGVVDKRLGFVTG
jgi:phosphoglycerate dehydrogenase-like enzyme